MNSTELKRLKKDAIVLHCIELQQQIQNYERDSKLIPIGFIVGILIGWICM